MNLAARHDLFQDLAQFSYIKPQKRNSFRCAPPRLHVLKASQTERLLVKFA
jgi:hypothetical protein